MPNNQITPEQLFELLERKAAVCLVDVRESEELLLSSLPNALHIPLMRVEENVEKLRQLSEDSSYQEWVIICRSGQRSEMARRWLVAEGIDNFRNLAGGLNDYAKKCDKSIARY